MPIEIRVPQLRESVVEATVGQWRKQPGQAVAAGEALVELETDKVNVEVAADQAGVLDRIDKPEGTNVQIGDLLGIFAEGATASAAVAAAPPPAPAPAESRPAAPNPPPAPTVPIQPVPVGRDGAQAAVPDAAGETGEATTASPAARHVAAEHGVDLNQVAGSGRGGRVTKEDVVTFVEQQRTGAALPPAAAPAPMPAPAPAPRPAAPLTLAPPQPEREERVRMSRRRQVIAQRLVEVQQIAAMLTTFNEVDMTAVMNLRRKRQEEFQKRHGVRLGFMSFFTKAVVGALKAQPYLNAEIQGDEVVLKRYYDVGIAVGAEGGLVVPVVRDADRKTFAQIERELGELAEKARQNTLKLEELQGGTFTITNGGIYGSLMSTPILNPPQVGILGMHKIQERPVASGGEVVIRPMMYLALSYDHRIVDGREAVTFLVRVKELIEDPESLLLEG